MKGPERALSALALLTVSALALFCALSPIWEMDVFWHVSVGRYILEHRALPTQNVWSAADPTQAYHPAQWLWEALASWLDRRWDLEALRLANAGLITAIFALAYLLLRRGERIGASLVISLLLLAAFHDRIRVRPHVVNLAGELLLTFFVARGDIRPLHFALVFLGFLLWGSLHAGGAVMMVAALAAVGVFALVHEKRRGVGRGRSGLLVIALAAGLGWILSPGSTRWIGGHDDAAIGYVEEWRAWPALVSGVGWYKLAHVVLARAFVPAAVIAFVVVLRRWRAAVRDEAERTRLGPPRELAWAVVLIVLAASAWRFFYLAALALVALRLAQRRIAGDGASVAPSGRARLLLAATGALTAAITLQYETADYASVAEVIESRGTTIDARYFPVMGTALLTESFLKARVATIPSWGGYVTYQGWPRLTTTIDGRFCAPDPVKVATLNVMEIINSCRALERLEGELDALPADFVILPRRACTARLPLRGWHKVATGPVEDLFLKKGGDGRWVEALRQVVSRHQLANVEGH